MEISPFGNVGRSEVTYSEHLEGPRFQRPRRSGDMAPPFTVTESIEEQTLLHVDLGVGYWLLRNPEASWITGFAPTVELHYTTTLEDADVAVLPGDGLIQ